MAEVTAGSRRDAEKQRGSDQERMETKFGGQSGERIVVVDGWMRSEQAEAGGGGGGRQAHVVREEGTLDLSTTPGAIHLRQAHLSRCRRQQQARAMGDAVDAAGRRTSGPTIRLYRARTYQDW